MSDVPLSSPAWDAVLPAGTRWLPGAGGGTRRLGDRGVPGGQHRPLAAGLRPWALSRRGPRGDPGGVRSYVAVPSQRSVILIASRDRDVLRYVAGSLLSVPPGTGDAASLAVTAGLRLLRFPLAWNLLALARLARLVAVGWSR